MDVVDVVRGGQALVTAPVLLGCCRGEWDRAVRSGMPGPWDVQPPRNISR